MSHSEDQPAKSILVIGSANIDFVMRVDRLPRPGETMLGNEILQVPGGKGANQAVAAARAGGRVHFIAAVGDDEHATKMIAGYERDGIDCAFVFPIEEITTGIATIVVDRKGQNMIFVAPGANGRLAPDHVNRVPDAIFQASNVCLASLEISMETVEQGLKRSRQLGLKSILNPAPAHTNAGDPKILELVDVLTPNETEAAQLVGFDAPPGGDQGRIEQAEKAANKLRQRGANVVIVTLGELGCLVVADEVTHIRATKVIPVDATAAGDAFNGALAVALAEGRSLVEAARWANRAAGLAVTKAGAQPSLPLRCEIDAAGDNLASPGDKR